jgi:hypothetical protein
LCPHHPRIAFKRKFSTIEVRGQLVKKKSVKITGDGWLLKYRVFLFKKKTHKKQLGISGSPL